MITRYFPYLMLSVAFAVGAVARYFSPAVPAPAVEHSEQVAVEETAAEALADEVNQAQQEQLKEWCEETRAGIREQGWDLEPCRDDVSWKIGGTSVEGRPLVYTEFGREDATNTTLVLATVHPDEVTPLYLGFQLVNWLKDNEESLRDARVVVAPFVNPDGFYKKPKTRTNARGVDPNRNFPTHDWKAKALAAWKRRYKSNPRRYPGSQPGSEPETLFQQELIRQVSPQKILSIHAPLNMVDYDGPSNLTLAKFPKDYIKSCLDLRNKLKASSGGFFPGSLGNFAGQERGIPTITLELPSADARKAEQYWQDFSKGIQGMIEFEMRVAGNS